MAANVETMFSVREKPWHGLGTIVAEAVDSASALSLSGLDWRVIQTDIETADGMTIPGYKANIRNTDNQVLGVVTDRYKVVQNTDAFNFTDALLGEGVRYETAGSLRNGRTVWILARLPHQYIITGDEITPYMLFSNSHDGSSSIKVCMTPIRVVCNNTLNLALRTTKRSWSAIHTGDMNGKLQDARDTLMLADQYMAGLGKEIHRLQGVKLQDDKVLEYINELLPLQENLSDSSQRKKNIIRLREDLKMRYFDAPDLQDVGKNAYRFVNAVSDFATHVEPLRRTDTYKERIFAKTVEGNALIDRACVMVNAA